MQRFILAGGTPELYRCDIVNLTTEEWYNEGKRNVPHGLFCFAYGLIGFVLYIPCIIVFINRHLFIYPVYKLFLYITICDTINLLTNSVLNGILLMEGSVYCNHPTFIYIWGCIEISAWFGACCGCFFLMLSRVVDIINPVLYEIIFAGKGIIVVFSFMFLYTLVGLFYAEPILFNSRATTWVFDPLIYPDGRDYDKYGSYINVLNNLGTVSTTMLMGFLFVFFFVYKLKKNFNYRIDSSQQQFLVQSCVVCLINFSSALIYLSFFYVPATPFVVFAGLATWQLSSGAGLTVFYILNKTIRNRLYKLWRLHYCRVAKISVTSVNPAAHQLSDLS